MFLMEKEFPNTIFFSTWKHGHEVVHCNFRIKKIFEFQIAVGSTKRA